MLLEFTNAVHIVPICGPVDDVMAVAAAVGEALDLLDADACNSRGEDHGNPISNVDEQQLSPHARASLVCLDEAVRAVQQEIAPLKSQEYAFVERLDENLNFVVDH